MIPNLIWMLKMKKLCCALSTILVLFTNGNVIAKDLVVDTQQQNNEEIIIEEKDLPKFNDIYSIIENEHVQEDVRELQYKLLILLKSLDQYADSQNSDEIKGSIQDIAQAQRRIDYLVSLESNLKKANSLERIKNLLGLNLSGKREIEKVLSLIDLIEKADSFQKIRQLPKINRNINFVIDKYENLEKTVKEANSIQKVKNIPNINPAFLQEIQNLENLLSGIKVIYRAEDLEKHPAINRELKDQINSLLSMESNLANANTLEKIKTLPYINQDVIKYVDNEIADNQKLRQKVEQLQKENDELHHRFNAIINETEKDRRFSTMLTRVILRALIGFDYRNGTYDFEKNKELKVAEKSALLSASKNSFSHLGGKEEHLYAITNGLHQILKVLLSQKNWVEKIIPIKMKLEAIAILCKKFNNDANMIRVNIDHALDIISNLQEGAKRPPRDNVQNFDIIAQNKQR